MKFKAFTFPVRYIYVYQNGSTSNAGNHIVEVQAFDKNGVNVALGKTVTASSNATQNGSYPWSRVTDGSTDTALYADFGAAGRTWVRVDLGAEYDLEYVMVWRYYADGRTYYETAVTALDAALSREVRLHEYSQQPLYAESAAGFRGEWVDLGANASGNKRTMYVYDGSSWLRKTLNQQLTTNYGDKYTFNNSGGYLYLNDQRWFNLNQNSFYFRSYVAKDSAGDRAIASFKNTTNTAGWSIVWLADGRIRWETRYNSTSYYSYSSNYLPATGTYYEVVIDFPNTGTGAGNMYWNGVWSSANRSGRHQMSANYLVLGTWGVWHRGYVRCKGIDSGGGYHDVYGYINNLTVGAGNHVAGSLGTINTTVSQDTWVTETWV